MTLLEPVVVNDKPEPGAADSAVQGRLRHAVTERGVVVGNGETDSGNFREEERGAGCKRQAHEHPSAMLVESSSEEDAADDESDEESEGEWSDMELDWLPQQIELLQDSGVESDEQPQRKRRRPTPEWLRAACSLGETLNSSAALALSASCHDGVENQIPPRVDDLYQFMVRRETARVRKELTRLPPHLWYPEDDLMLSIRLTNVRREDDATTRVVRAMTEVASERWRDFETLPDEGWCEEQRKLAGLLIFHCALWRAFGTKEFVRAIGFMDDLKSWQPLSWAKVVDAAMACWQRGLYCFTDAYQPPRSRRRVERWARCHADQELAIATVRELFEQVCRHHLYNVWQSRLDVALVAQRTRSWRAVTERLMQVPSLGGTGFLAKELTQDLLRTPLFSTWSEDAGRWQSHCWDVDLWCAVGPGARRGLDRLHGRPVGINAYSKSQVMHGRYLKELLSVFEQRRQHWDPEDLLDEIHPAGELELHDVQFQLCEFDKYERARLGQGFVRPYVSSGDS